MEQREYVARVLKPDEGKYLTQAAENVELSQRVVSTEVWLGVDDSPENWKEISQAEGEEIRAAQEEARKGARDE